MSEAIFWPGTKTPKSTGNAFTSHLTQPRSSIQFKQKPGVKPFKANARFQQDAEKARVFYI
jgi:hypothetical protein